MLLELCLNILIEQLCTQILLSRKSLIPVVVNQQLVQFVEVPTHVRQLASHTKQLLAATLLYCPAGQLVEQIVVPDTRKYSVAPSVLHFEH